MDDVLIGHVKNALLERLKTTSFAQIVQTVVNIEYFYIACQRLDKLVSNSGEAPLRAIKEFSDSRDLAEKRIFEVMQLRADEFLEIADYDWTTTERHQRPSTYLEELSGFLGTVISSSLVNLPTEVRKYAFFDIFDHLAASLRKMLLSPDVTKISEAGAQNFSRDVKFLEDFCGRLGREDASSLLSAPNFVALRQLVLLLTGSFTDSGLQDYPSEKFSNVDSADAKAIANKIGINDVFIT